MGEWRIKHDLKIRVQTIDKHIRKGDLVAREILDDTSKRHHRFFKERKPLLSYQVKPREKIV